MTEPLRIDAQAISRRAHELWLKRGCPTGTPELDWQEAERELRSEALMAGAANDRAPKDEAAKDAAASNPGLTSDSGRGEPRPSGALPRLVSSGDGAPRVPRPRAPRTIITRAGHAPAARLLLALVPEADASRAPPVERERASRRR